MTKTHEVKILLSEAEFEKWNNRAIASGLSLTEFVSRAVGTFDADIDAELRSLKSQADSISEKATILSANILSVRQLP